MEIYAAMVDGIDQNLGRLFNHLKAIGEYDDTFIFISDNGAEGIDRGGPARGWDNRLENLGRINSYVYGEKWAQAGVGVSRYYKSLSSEGGSLGPAIIYHKDMTKKGQLNDEFMSVVDFYPTFVELLVAAISIREATEPIHEVQGALYCQFCLAILIQYGLKTLPMAGKFLATEPYARGTTN